MNVADHALVVMDNAGGKKFFYPIESGEVARKSMDEFISNYPKLPRPAQIMAAHKLREASIVYGNPLPDSFPSFLLKEKYPEYTGSNVLYIKDLAELEVTPPALATEKQASAVRKIAGRFPVADKEHLKLASIYFECHACQMTTDERRQFCCDFVKIAEDFKMEIPGLLAKYAGYKLNPYFETHMNKRIMDIDTHRSWVKVASTESNIPNQVNNVLLTSWPFVGSDNTSIIKEAYTLIKNNRHALEPDRICAAISYLDKVAGIVGATLDAVLITFAPYTTPIVQEKRAEVEFSGKALHPEDLDWERTELVLDEDTLAKIKKDFSHIKTLEPHVIKSLLK